MLKVLIAEDDRTTQHLLASIVRGLNLVPMICSDGEMAWNFLCDNTDTALVLVDMQMPKMDGRELLGRIKADPKLAEIPFIIVSGVVKLSEISDLLLNGASYFVPKPIDSKDLCTYARRLIERNSNHAASAV